MLCGGLAPALAAMVNLRNGGRDFVVVFVATRRNCMDLEKNAELAIALGALWAHV